MDFEPNPSDRATAQRARAVVSGALGALTADPSTLARKAHALFGAARLLGGVTAPAAALAVIEASEESAALGAVLASGWHIAAALGRHRDAADELLQGLGAGSIVGTLALSGSASQDGAAVSGELSTVLHGDVADVALVWAHGEAAAPDRLVVVDLRAHGVRRGEALESGLLRRATLHLAATPIARTLLEGDRALRAHQALLDDEHWLAAAVAVGIARGAFELSRELVRGRGPSNQSTDFVLADMSTLADAAELGVLRAASLAEEGAPRTAESSGAKLVAARAATRIVHDALGLSRDAATTVRLERAYLDARSVEMHHGPEATQIDRIARVMLDET